ncbi:diacylglycerol/lipid kinase family protein [Microbacterium sp. NPDC057659]|uniref:diacylglycerol/lipid kinase family protein n=1 Tax=Microbacterium sp. NPDC057659 TaxID=3346198 RepID=UPI00366D20F7
MSGIGIIWNPSKIDRSDLEAALGEVSAASAEDLAWYETSAEDAGREAAQRALADGAELLLAAGGDGTVRAVVEHLAEAGGEAELGIIPLGTGNLLARNLDIPMNDPGAAFSRALTGTAEPIDVGWADVTGAEGTMRRAFAVMAGFGIDAHMITETDDDLKDRAGWLAYVESLGRALSASEVIDLRVGVDGAEEHENAHTVIVGNCGMLQGGVTLLPDADPADGELDLLVLRADGVAGWLDTMKNMAWDNGLKRLLSGRGDVERAESSGSTAHSRFRELTIELAEPREFEVDGDELGEVTRVGITIQPSAVRVR